MGGGGAVWEFVFSVRDEFLKDVGRLYLVF